MFLTLEKNHNYAGCTVNQHSALLKSARRTTARQLRTITHDAGSRVMDWLLEDNQPVVRYFALVDLLGRERNDPDVKEARSSIAKKGWASDILGLQSPDGRWKSKPPGSLYGPKYTATNWMSLILSDFGLTRENPQARKAAGLFFSEWMDPAKENIFNDEVCIAGNTARMLTRFGYADDSRVGKLFDRLVEDQKEDGGWHCFKSSTGTLDCWEGLAAYSALPEPKRTRKIRNSIERGAEFYLERKLFDDGERKYLPCSASTIRTTTTTTSWSA